MLPAVNYNYLSIYFQNSLDKFLFGFTDGGKFRETEDDGKSPLQPFSDAQL